MKIIIFFRTLLSYFLLGIIAIIIIPFCMIILCLPENLRYDNKLFFWLCDLFFKLVIKISFCPHAVIGKENLPLEPAIFVANHQSALDIPVVGELLNGYPHVWLVLQWYVTTPILGFFIRRMFIPVERDDPAKAARSLIQVLKFIKDKKRHLIIFPEGTRYVDPKVHEFFPGFAVIAKKTQRAVIPVYMPNNGKIYPYGSFLVHRFPIKVIIGKPMMIEDNETTELFCKRVHQWFLDEYFKLFS